MRVVVLTTSYPRGPEDVAGVFVRDAVEHLRTAGIAVEVVSPATFRHFGLAYGHGIVGNLKRRPWLAFVVPLFLLSVSRAARRAARGADVVHAHWLPSALPAIATRKPFVVQFWGTDVELAGRARWLSRRLLRRARLVLCPSQALAQA
ncbi:MAG TPA: glycosyltransferase, partial [Gaiellaceae bacterium]|nr:glycosyltransferase [Gaiellaceae bacterium]